MILLRYGLFFRSSDQADMKDRLFWRLCWSIGCLGLVATEGPNVQYFRSSPQNNFYDAMFVSVTTTLGLVNGFLLFQHLKKEPERPLYYKPWNALCAFEIMLSLLVSILSFVGGIYGFGSIFLIVFLGLLFLEIYRIPQEVRVTYAEGGYNSKYKRVGLSIFYFLIAIGFFAFPVFQQWSGPPEKFVRWYEFTINGELVWRGVFASYALGFLYCLLDPFHVHFMYVAFVSVSGLTHATVMLIMNLVELQNEGKNGNAEHLYGDIAGWYVVAIVSLLCIVKNRPYQRIEPANLP